MTDAVATGSIDGSRRAAAPAAGRHPVAGPVTAVQCPRCGHARTAADTAPPWQCPACGIAYHKYASYLARTAARVARPADTDVVTGWRVDASLWMLILANFVAIGVGMWQGWSLGEMMLLYWAQSVVIGATNALRILALGEFTTDNFRINDIQPPATAATKIRVAVFFVLHFGIFHVVYLAFLMTEAGAARTLGPAFVLCVAGFVANHLFSLAYNIAVDRRGRPNIGSLMFTPYLRIIPMHLMIVGGAFLMDNAAGIVAFGLLKTLADAVMHLVEHARYGGRVTTAVAIGGGER